MQRHRKKTKLSRNKTNKKQRVTQKYEKLVQNDQRQGKKAKTVD